MKHLRLVRRLLWALALLAAFAAGGLFLARSMTGDGPETAGGVPLGDRFALVDHEGRPVTEAVLRGKPSAVFFGFTNCPDVCPTALADMTAWADELEAAADRMRFVFVTVDPERDTPAALKDYLQSFSPRIIGISGDPVAVAAMVKDYKIYSRKVPLEGGGYTMDHTASILLLDAEGGLAGTIAAVEDRDDAMAKLRRLVAE